MTRRTDNLLAILIFLIYMLLLGWSVARAAPPPKGSEDWELMQPYVEWITHQSAPEGQWCCDLSDGRPLFSDEWRAKGDGYEVFISRRHWATAPEPGVWVSVPANRITAPSPMGLVVVWWSDIASPLFPNGFVYCFAPVGGV